MNEEENKENILEMFLDEIKNKNLNYLKIDNIEILYNGKKPKGTFNNTTGAIYYDEFIIRRDILNE